MKLLAKFSLIFVLVFGVGLAAAGYLSYALLQQNAHEQVLDHARLMMDSAKAIRGYTTQQIKPLVAHVGDDGVFHPQTVPAFAATEIFDALRKDDYKEYSYREATLNPTNPRDRAVDWEADVINHFRDHPDVKTSDGQRDTPAGKSVFIAAPLRAGKACLECHSTPDAAPAAMVKQYGTANGFGWKENEVIGAQIVSVPASVPERRATQAFQGFMFALGGVGAAMLIALNVVLYLTVVRPVRRFAENADRISHGEMDVPELPARGSDEISVLAASFNRMRRSLASAMHMLEHHQ